MDKYEDSCLPFHISIMLALVSICDTRIGCCADTV